MPRVEPGSEFPIHDRRLVYSCVVHENVDSTFPGNRLAPKSLDLLRGRQVRSDDRRGVPDLDAQIPDGTVRSKVVKNDRAADLDQRPCGSPADASGGTGHENDPVA